MAGQCLPEETLNHEIKKKYGGEHYYSFRSARAALAGYLQSICEPGDEVILGAFTCLAVPAGLVAARVTPVYVDINPETLSADWFQIKSKISSKTRAIVIQHTLGAAVDVTEMRDYANELGIVVIEDCALSIGSVINQKKVGSMGDAAIFSMELSKLFHVGVGYCVSTRHLIRRWSARCA